MSLVVFRTDASAVIGSGHVMRCLTLASALRSQHVNATFICRAQDNDLCDHIESQGFAVARLSTPTSATVKTDAWIPYSDWLGAPWQVDVDQSRAAIALLGEKPDWLVVDHYGIDARWEQELRTVATRCMVIDDLADRAHDCDLLLDQNVVADMLTRYALRVPSPCVQLLGPEFALLQPMYAQLHACIEPRKGAVQRIFIYFGGIDSHNMTGRTLSACRLLDNPEIEIDVVISSASPCAQTVREQAAGACNVRIHTNLATLAPLMARADIAIGAGGATTWERLCLGLPSLVITVAENQCPVISGLHDQNLVYWIGHHDQVDQIAIAEALKRVVSMGTLGDWSRRCLGVCDGGGVSRVIDRIVAF